MLLILLKTIGRTSFYYCPFLYYWIVIVSPGVFTRMQDTICTEDGKIKGPLHGAVTINCKKCTHNKL